MPHASIAWPRSRACPARARSRVKSGRYARSAWLALVAAIAAGCSSPPIHSSDENGAGAPVRVETGKGPVSNPERVVRRLARQGDSDLLAHHLTHVAGALREPLVLGNDAHLLVDGPQTHDAMFKAIDDATRRIHMETYIVESGEIGARLAELLGRKRAQGVEVRVMYDSVGSLATEPGYFERLTSAGVAVCEFNPVDLVLLEDDSELGLNNRNHRKILVVDGRVGFTGGINISRVYRAGSFGSGREIASGDEGWRDTHVMVRGPVVAQLDELFARTWREQSCPDPIERPLIAKPGPAGGMAMRVVAADPTSQRSELYVALLSALDHAQVRAWLTYGYFVPDERTLRTLTDAARRGVDVRLVLPGFSDFWVPLYAGRSHYGELLDAGVRVFERRDALLHAKTAVIDGVWSSVGSTNLDWRSFVHNFEADVLVLDGKFAGEMEALFRRDEGTSHEVTLDEWKNRGLKNRLLEWFARLWEYWL